MPTRFLGPVHEGVQIGLVDESPTAAGSTTVEFSVESDSVLVTLFVAAVSGTLDVAVYGLAETNAALLFEFPQISSPTAELLLRRAAVAPSRIRVVATYSAACTYKIHGRAVDGGAADARILGASDLSTSQVDVPPGTPTLLIAAALDDRSGLLVKNWSTAGNLYVGASTGEATVAAGYPLAPRDALAVDLAAGVPLYGISDAGTLDVRIAESGG